MSSDSPGRTGPGAGTSERERTLRLDVLAGTVTALVGVIGYFPAPIAASEYVDRRSVQSGLDVVAELLSYFFTRSLLYHAAILLLPPLVTTVAALGVGRAAARVTRRPSL